MVVRLQVIYMEVDQVVHDQVILEAVLRTDLRVAVHKSLRGHELLMEHREEFMIRELVKLSAEGIIQRKGHQVHLGQVLAVNVPMVAQGIPKHILVHPL